MKKYFKSLMIQYPNLLKISQNSFWIMGDNLFRFGLGFFLTIWIARSLGPTQFGIFNYVLTFMAVLTSMMGLGLEVVVVRMLSRNPGQKDGIILAALSLRLYAAMLLFFVLGLFLWHWEGVALDVRCMIAIIALGLFFQSFDVIDYYFQSRLLSKYVVWAKSSVFLLISMIKVAILFLKAPLIFLVMAASLEIILGGVVLFFIFRKFDHNSAIFDRPDKNVVFDLIKQGWPLGLSGLGTCIYMRADQFIIARHLGDAALGVYTAALRLSEMWYFIPMALIISITPKIIELQQTDCFAYKANLQKIFDHMFLLAAFFSILLSLSSLFLVRFFFGEVYAQAGCVLFWHAWTGIFVGLGLVVNVWLIAEDLQHYILYKVVLSAILSVILNLIFVPLFGILGSAFSAVIAYAATILFLGFFPRGREGVMMCLQSFLSLKDLLRPK